MEEDTDAGKEPHGDGGRDPAGASQGRPGGSRRGKEGSSRDFTATVTLKTHLVWGWGLWSCERITVRCCQAPSLRLLVMAAPEMPSYRHSLSTDSPTMPCGKYCHPILEMRTLPLSQGKSWGVSQALRPKATLFTTVRSGQMTSRSQHPLEQVRALLP